MKNPGIYLAGKIGVNDWRHDLVPKLRGAMYEDGPIDGGGFDFVGPFFISCSHRCFHGDTSHGVLLQKGAIGVSCCNPNGYPLPDRREVARRAREGVRSADLIFAYIEAVDCIGTMAEIGAAVQLGKSVLICIDTTVDAGEFWLVQRWPGVTLIVDVDRSDLPKLFAAALATLRSRSAA